jgi:mersacidin/lichenicidin family type 2 lantibiotic
MSNIDIVKAWKDEDYRETLTLEQRANLPAHPSGIIDFEDPEKQEEGSFEATPVACKRQTNTKSWDLSCCRHPSFI